MSVPNGQSDIGGDRGRDYDESYYRSDVGSDEPYEWASPQWRTFFRAVAERIRAVTNPSSVLDVGCARGLLVQAFCEQGVDAYGIDVSQHAIETAHPDVASRLSVGSAEQVEGSWDLITCIEVLEHMAPVAAERAIDSMCAASDRILMSSTPSDFEEPTHINVREPAAWAASFAERGFFRRTDVDLSFLAPWTVLFERADVTRRELVTGTSDTHIRCGSKCSRSVRHCWMLPKERRARGGCGRICRTRVSREDDLQSVVAANWSSATGF